jgi:hypothetical protein
MKHSRRIAELSRAVLDRRDPEECLELLRLCGRLGTTEAREQLTGVPARALLAAWGAAPADRSLAELLLPLLGWETVPRGVREPGTWWSESKRLGEGADHDYDTATGLPLYVRVQRTGTILARVPAGRLAPEHARQVKLDGVGDARVEAGFWMGVHEVSVGEYREVLGAQALQGNLYARDETMPVRHVSWLDAVRFCRTLDDFDGGPVPVIYRPPRVLEWELALELGGQWGRPATPEQARIRYEERLPGPLPVGGREPDALGLEDLVGNVSELALERTDTDFCLPRTWVCDQPVLPDDVVCDLEDLHFVAEFLFHPRGQEFPYPGNLDRIEEVFGQEVGQAFYSILTRGPYVPVLGAAFHHSSDLLDGWLRQRGTVGNRDHTVGFRLVAAPASCLDCAVHG